MAIVMTVRRELTAKAWDVAVIEVSANVKRNMKNLAGSTMSPVIQNMHETSYEHRHKPWYTKLRQ